MRAYALGATGIPGTGAMGGLGPSGQSPTGYCLGGRAGDARPRAAANLQPIIPVLPPESAAAQQQYRDYAQGGNLGFSALTGNAGAAQQFLNPYLSQLNPFFAQQRQQAIEQANQQAT